MEVNPAVCRMHGYQRDELIGSLTTTIIHPGDHPLFTDFADAIAHGHEFRARRRDVTRDGRVFDVEVCYPEPGLPGSAASLAGYRPHPGLYRVVRT